MQTKFEKFVNLVLEIGEKRLTSIWQRSRDIPCFVPVGHYQDALFQKSKDYLSSINFNIIDIRNKSFDDWIEDFNLTWPLLVDKRPNKEEYEIQLDDSQKKLLLLGGKNPPEERFFKYWARDNVLYSGTSFPPIKYLSPKCFVIPNSACVAIMVKAEDFYNNYPSHLIGPVIGPVETFNSNEVPFID